MKWIFFFDGDCAFCSGSIRRIARLDRRDHIRFSPLQGDLARSKGLGLSGDPGADSMYVLRERDGKIFSHSCGILEIARALGFPFNLALVFLLVPRPLRDAFYRWFAANRYRWFGKTDHCTLPDESILRRLL